VPEYVAGAVTSHTYIGDEDEEDVASDAGDPFAELDALAE